MNENDLVYISFNNKCINNNN